MPWWAVKPINDKQSSCSTLRPSAKMHLLARQQSFGQDSTGGTPSKYCLSQIGRNVTR
jgi:hypothetical protein